MAEYSEEEEYHAKAMLLGMEYLPGVHAFWYIRARNTNDTVIDADTMELVSDDEFRRRIERSLK